MRKRLLLAVLLSACSREPEPSEFERRCEELLRDVLPDVHAVLGRGVGRPVSVREVDRPLIAAPLDAPGEIHVAPRHWRARWERRAVTDVEAQDRDLALHLAHQLARVYQAERHPWMRMREENADYFDDRERYRGIWPSDSHAMYVANEIARRRGYEPWFTWEREFDWLDQTSDWFRDSWNLRDLRIWTCGRAYPSIDGDAHFAALADRHGHDGAIRILRYKERYTQSELLWPRDPDPEAAEVRARLRGLFAPDWGELEVGRVHPRALETVVPPGSKLGRGWQVESRAVYDSSQCARMLLFPASDAEALLASARRSVASYESARDVAALIVRDVPGGFAAELVAVSKEPSRWTEHWIADGNWIVVFYGSDLCGSDAWAGAWMRSALRVAGDGGKAIFEADGWVARLHALGPLDLSEPDRLASAVPQLRAWGVVRNWPVFDDESEAFAARLRGDRARPVKIAIGTVVDDLLERSGPGTHARALVQSLLADEDPFVRYGAIDSHRLPAPVDGPEDEWNWYWRFVLTDPIPALRYDPLIALSVHSYKYDDFAGAGLLLRPVPGRPTVEAAIRELVDDPLFSDEALEFLVRLGSEDSSLWPRLVARLRDAEVEPEFETLPWRLLAMCPVPGGDRRSALEALLDDENEKLREWAESALSLLE